MIALLDGDIFAYRLACVLEKYESKVFADTTLACQRLREFVLTVCEGIQADSLRVFLSPPTRELFRKEIDPKYKSNRDSLPRPALLSAFKSYLIDELSAEVRPPYEADDLMAINQTDESVIVSIDKDMLQVPGRHYNFVKHRWQLIEEPEGIKNYLVQCCTGDTTDNIHGLVGIGPFRANKLLGSYSNLRDGLFNVLSAYKERARLGDGYTNCKLVWIAREFGQTDGPDELKEAYDAVQAAERKE